MTKKAGAAEGEAEGEEETDGEGKENQEPTDAEKRAQEAEARAEAAEKKSAEKEAELEAVRSRANANTARSEPPSGGYVESSFSTGEWEEAERSTGLDRKQILFNLNQQVRTKKEVRDAVGILETRLAIRDERDSMAADDPLYPKYRKEVDKFLSDIPAELMASADGRKKWLAKAFDYAKKSVKLPSGSRSADGAPNTRETGKGKDQEPPHEYSADEKAVFDSHGKKPEDYDKIRHPYMKEGILIKDRPEAPRFGSK